MDIAGVRSAASLSPTSPVSVRSHAGANGGSKRKRNSVTVASAIASSPDSDHDDDVADHPEKKRQPGVKRACNECRQQKVSHRASRPHRSTAMLNVLLASPP